ncbi:hypothetical protein BDV12DRAFT_160451 [Aspergillus spectabilis]
MPCVLIEYLPLALLSLPHTFSMALSGVSALDKACRPPARSSVGSLEPRRIYSHLVRIVQRHNLQLTRARFQILGFVLLFLIIRGLLDWSGVSSTISCLDCGSLRVSLHLASPFQQIPDPIRYSFSTANTRLFIIVLD